MWAAAAAASSVNQQACGAAIAPPKPLCDSGCDSNVCKSLIIKGGHKHLMACHEYFNATGIRQKWPPEFQAINEPQCGPINSNTRPRSRFVWGFSPFFSSHFSLHGTIGLICHLQQTALGHGAMDNPIYRFAIYYKFLWLLGPLSHWFVDCLLSWVLMSCCLNHCIIAALIHFLACPHSHSACWLAKIREEWNGARSSTPPSCN